MEKATFAAGCFWGVEATSARSAASSRPRLATTGATRRIRAIVKSAQITTGHAEVVQVEYDPARVSYD